MRAATITMPYAFASSACCCTAHATHHSTVLLERSLITLGHELMHYRTENIASTQRTEPDSTGVLYLGCPPALDHP